MTKIYKEFYKAVDGKIFETSRECEEYEANITYHYRGVVRISFDVPFDVDATCAEEAKKIILEEAEDVDLRDLYEDYDSERKIECIKIGKIGEDE